MTNAPASAYDMPPAAQAEQSATFALLVDNEPGVLARVAARKAHPTQQPCERCGVARADRHHDDYTRPLDIRWLCRRCHIAEHVEQYGSWGEGLAAKPL